MGAGLAVSEMVTADPKLWHTSKSKFRLDHQGEQTPRAVQIAGGDAEMMATAARLNVAQGAQLIDINMGCPAKKVCKKAAGSALMRNEKLVREILEAVVAAVHVPVTLKMRTGWDTNNRNAVTLATMAEAIGVQALAIHGRTRACAYHGEVEYDTIAAVKQSVSIPVLANGDIDSATKAKQVLQYTGADGVMIGRAAQGKPWLIKQIAHYLAHDDEIPEPALGEQQQILIQHLQALHKFYGEYLGVRIARKHVGWYLNAVDSDKLYRRAFNQIDSSNEQIISLNSFFDMTILGEGKAA